LRRYNDDFRDTCVSLPDLFVTVAVHFAMARENVALKDLEMELLAEGASYHHYICSDRPLQLNSLDRQALNTHKRIRR